MKRTLSLIGLSLTIALALFVGAYAATQGWLAPTASAQDTEVMDVDTSRTITVVGQGTVTIEPDQAQAMIGVETFGDTAKSATHESSQIMEDLLEALTEEDVAEKDIQTSGFSIWTDRGRTPEGRMTEEVTYRVNNTVRVIIRDLDKVSAVLDAAIEAGANSIHGVNFSISDPDEIESEARLKAVADAKAKAEELADLTGVDVGAIVSISEVVGNGGIVAVREQAAMGMGGGAGPISPGEMDYTLQLQVVYAIQ